MKEEKKMVKLCRKLKARTNSFYFLRKSNILCVVFARKSTTSVVEKNVNLTFTVQSKSTLDMPFMNSQVWEMYFHLEI